MCTSSILFIVGIELVRPCLITSSRTSSGTGRGGAFRWRATDSMSKLSTCILTPQGSSFNTFRLAAPVKWLKSNRKTGFICPESTSLQVELNCPDLKFRESWSSAGTPNIGFSITTVVLMVASRTLIPYSLSNSPLTSAAHMRASNTVVERRSPLNSTFDLPPTVRVRSNSIGGNNMACSLSLKGSSV